MALRNYLYAKHVQDEFAVSLRGKTDIESAQPKGLTRDQLEPQTNMQVEVQPQPVEPNPKEVNENCHNDVCNNCADCKSDKTKPKIPVEIGDGISKLSIREIDFTF